jgi:hypothetical protein
MTSTTVHLTQERTVGSAFIRPLLDDLAVRELPVGHPDGHVLRRGSGLAVGLVLPSGPAEEAEHSGLPALSVS